MIKLNENTKDALAVIAILIIGAAFFWIGWGFLDYIGWGAENS